MVQPHAARPRASRGPVVHAAARRDDDLPAEAATRARGRRPRSRGRARGRGADGERRAAASSRSARVVIGRSKECDIQVPDPNVSRKHARDRPGGRGVLDRRPRLDERDRGERTPAEAGEARRRRPDHARLDRGRVRPRDDVILDSIQVDEALLVLKVLFLVLLYLFIWRIVRSASRDVRVAAGELHPRARLARGRAARRAPAEPGRLVVVKSPALEQGAGYKLDSAPLTIGRGGAERRPRSGATSSPRRGTRASSSAATGRGSRTSAPRTARTSTGSSSRGRASSQPGDVLRVGSTELRYER